MSASSSSSSAALYNDSSNKSNSSNSSSSNNERVLQEKRTDYNNTWKGFNNNQRRSSLLSHPTEVVNNDLFSYAFPAPSPSTSQQQQQVAPWSSSSASASSTPFYNNIASVPMLPEVSEEPFYRQQRSMSYSFGASGGHNLFSPTPNYLHDTQNTTFMQQQQQKQQQLLLEEEEEEEEQDMLLQQQRSMYIRTRSKSTAAVMMAPEQYNIWNPQKKELEDDAKWFAQHNKRRSSLVSSSTILPPMMTSSSSSTTTTASNSSGMRWYSLAPAASYFENNTNNHHNINNSKSMLLVGQRRHSLAGPTTLHHPPPSMMMNSILEIEGLSIREKASIEQKVESTIVKTDDMGKGIRLDLLHNVYFYVVEFKAGRSDVFYSAQVYKKNELVIVEADRGRDLGKIGKENISKEQLEIYYAQLKNVSHSSSLEDEEQQQKEEMKTVYQANEIYVKNIYRMAKRDEVTLFMAKAQDEAKVLMVCQFKIKQKKLNMQVLDAEYQWDKRKLTFYFIAEKRVDFRELVRELFKLYKTRIWMCAMNSIKVLE